MTFLIERNTRTKIILTLLKELNAHERLDLPEHLEFLTELFYDCRNKYLQNGYDQMGAKELAMDDLKNYIISDKDP